VRYFCDGAVLGTATFVNAVFEREQTLRQRFGEKRTTGARRMRGADWGELRVLRDLQKGCNKDLTRICGIRLDDSPAHDSDQSRFPA
jgi:hypothetical protein